jgi:hypothetical protein
MFPATISGPALKPDGTLREVPEEESAGMLIKSKNCRNAKERRDLFIIIICQLVEPWSRLARPEKEAFVAAAIAGGYRG